MNPNPDRDERVKEIRERLETVRYSPMFAKSAVVTMESYQAALRDVDTLLSLLDGQAPTVHRNYECMTTVADETLWCPTCAARAEYLRGYATAATRMRDRCVAKVESIAQKFERESFAEAGNQRLIEKTRVDTATAIAKELEALTLEGEQEKSK